MPAPGLTFSWASMQLLMRRIRYLSYRPHDRLVLKGDLVLKVLKRLQIRDY
jgi:hypothetical protein